MACLHPPHRDGAHDPSPASHCTEEAGARAGGGSAPVTDSARFLGTLLRGAQPRTASPLPGTGSLAFWWLRVGRVLELCLRSPIHQYGSETSAVPSVSVPTGDVLPPLKEKGRAARCNVQTQILNQ